MVGSEKGVQLKGYSIFATSGRVNRNDGVLVYVKNGVNATVNEVRSGDVCG